MLIAGSEEARTEGGCHDGRFPLSHGRHSRNQQVKYRDAHRHTEPVDLCESTPLGGPSAYGVDLHLMAIGPGPVVV